MKLVWQPYLLTISILFFYACGEKHKPVTENQNRVFTQNPALNDLTDKIATHPDDAKLYYQRGNLLHNIREDSLALKDFNKAVSLDSTRSEYFSARESSRML